MTQVHAHVCADNRADATQLLAGVDLRALHSLYPSSPPPFIAHSVDKRPVAVARDAAAAQVGGVAG
jgi:hypothetical protein